MHVQRSKHQRNRAEQLDKHVKRRTSSILEGITNRVTNHASLVRLTLLAENDTVGVEAINHLTLCVHTQIASFNVLLRVVPCATTVIQEGTDNDTTHRTDHEHTSFSLWAKDNADSYGGEHSNDTREDHCTQCTTCADVNTASIIGI